MTPMRNDRRDQGLARRTTSPARRGHKFRSGGLESLEGRQLMAASPLAELGTVAGHRAHDVATPADTTSQAQEVFYNTSGIAIQPVSAWQGIVAGGSAGEYFITGTSTKGAKETGILYEGPISGQGGTTYAVHYPGFPVTSAYGVTDLGGDNIRVVGSVRRAGHIQGFVFQGTTATLGDRHDYRIVNDPKSIYTFMHSTMNDLAVGDSNAKGTKSPVALGADRSFIYDTANHKILTQIAYPGATSTTAYGIWYNGGSSYTIDGGYGTSGGSVNGYMVDYDATTGQFSNWTSFTAPNVAGDAASVTHFEGISSPAPGVYTLSADSGLASTSEQGWWVTVDRQSDGTFGPATWVPLVDSTNSATAISDNSVAGNQVVGIMVTSSGTVAYMATVTPTTTS